MSRRRHLEPFRKYSDCPSRDTRRFTEISLNFTNSPGAEPSLLSKTSSIDACPTGLRALEPLKITSVMDSPRRYLAELSPITQRTASMILDLPQPFGPTTAVRFVGNGTVVGSTNDLKPASLMDFSRISRALLHENAQHLLSLMLAEFADRLLQASGVILDCGISQVPEEGRRLCYFATEMLKCNVVSAADGRAKILKGLLQERIFNQTIGILNNTKASLNYTLCSVIGIRIKRINNFPEFINLPHQSAQFIARPAF